MYVCMYDTVHSREVMLERKTERKKNIKKKIVTCV